jgi:hypothetical protein
MKAWEETWRLDRKGDLRTPHQCIAQGLVSPAADADDGNLARLRLAECAPEMARMLVRLRDTEPPGSEWYEEIYALLRKAGVRE